MSSSIDYLDSIIWNANYLRNLIRDNKVPNSLDLRDEGLREIDFKLDSICDFVNDVNDEIGRG